MTDRDDRAPNPGRRGFLVSTVGLAAAGAVGGAGMAPRAAHAAVAGNAATGADGDRVEPFFAEHQGGIVTPAQKHSYFAAFDLTAAKREDVAALLKAWTAAAANLAAGRPAAPPQVAPAQPVSDQTADDAGNALMVMPDDKGGDDKTGGKADDSYGVEAGQDTAAYHGDSGETLGLSPQRLTLTFGFGPGLFAKDGKDRYGLASRRPEALADLPHFAGDQLVESRSGGDLSVQACADDPQVAFHAIRQLAAIAGQSAQIRWAQSGFLPGYGPGATPRNLMGFKDGTNNPAIGDPQQMAAIVWVGEEGPDWMKGGSYLVARRIRIALEHWDRMGAAFQERTFGRRKDSGAPLGKEAEFEPLGLDRVDTDGNPVIAENSHVRLATAASNGGAQILRRPYSYNDGVNFTAERWPPWRQGMEYDAGLFFVCYQRDPRTGFVRIFERMAKLDLLNQFVTHTGGGLFACPRGAAPGEYIGQLLLESA